MSAKLHELVGLVVVRAISLLGNLVVLPFALAHRRTH
jgi:hypothetical protein